MFFFHKPIDNQNLYDTMQIWEAIAGLSEL